MPGVKELYPETASLCGLVNDETNGIQTLWTGFLAYAAFVVIIVLATTPEMLLLGAPVNLPVISVQLDLIGFYIAAPLLLVIFHLYLLMKLFLLARLYHQFEQALRQDARLKIDRSQMRRHLNNTLFAQALNSSQRTSIRRLCRDLIALTVGGLPVAALVLVLVRFLPYQSEVVTWIQRILLAVDLAALTATGAVFIRGGEPGIPGRHLAALASAWTLLTGVLWLILTFPGEALDNAPLARLFVTPKALGDLSTTSLHGVFPTTLQLAKADIVKQDDKALEAVDAAIVLRNRSLRGADFSGADLRKVVFQAADLTGANFSGARLAQTDFGCFSDQSEGQRIARDALIAGAIAELAAIAPREDAGSIFWRALGKSTRDFGCATLTGATFDSAVLVGTRFRGALLTKVTFNKLETFRDADFSDAILLDVGMNTQSYTISGGNFDNAVFIRGDARYPMSAKFVGGSFRGALFRQIGTKGDMLTFTSPDLGGVNFVGTSGSLEFEGPGGSGTAILEKVNLDRLILTKGASGIWLIQNSNVSQIMSRDTTGRLWIRCSSVSFLDGRRREAAPRREANWRILLSKFDRIYLRDATVQDLSIEASTVRELVFWDVIRPIPIKKIASTINLIGSTIGILDTIRVNIGVIGVQATDIRKWNNVATALDRLYYWGSNVSAYERKGDNMDPKPSLNGLRRQYTGDTEQGDANGDIDLSSKTWEQEATSCAPGAPVSLDDVRRRIDAPTEAETLLPPALASLRRP